MISQLFELYARCGSSLLDNGLFEAILPISEVNHALELFQQNSFIILGGDLYRESSPGCFESIYANWFYNGKNIQESIGLAHSYLEQFRDQEVFVSFTFKG